MKYIAILFILLPSLYTLSFAKHSWSKKNKAAAIGAALVALASVVLPIVVLSR